MARRKKNEHFIDIMVTLPWWVSVCFGIGGYMGMRWMLPAMLQGPLQALGPALQSLAWLPLVVFSLLALVAAARAHTTAHDARGSPGSRASPRKQPTVGSKLNERSEPESAWGRNADSAMSIGTKWGRAADSASISTSPVPISEWTLEALRALEWKRFELLCAKYYEEVGFKSETVHCGPDGGIDIKLFRVDPAKPFAIVQCKAWNGKQVGVALVRELLGVMASEKVERGVFLTTSTYSKDALAFATSNPIQLLAGVDFIKKIRELPVATQTRLLEYSFAGDYTTPTCASCGIKMVERDGKRGKFYGCTNYPRCGMTLDIKS